jgi:predicted  nucleic acid-binding Zn-ribbon protein
MRRQRTALLQVAEAVHRHDRRFDDMERRFNEVKRRFGDVERRISDTRTGIELMLKSELAGRLTHCETQMDERIAQLEDRLAAIEPPHGSALFRVLSSWREFRAISLRRRSCEPSARSLSL